MSASHAASLPDLPEEVGQYDFDEVIDRNDDGVPALKSHPIVVGNNQKDLFAAGVADMDFKVAKPIRDAMQKRLQHGIFGYETTRDGLIPSLVEWQSDRHGWKVQPEEILRSPNILNALSMAACLYTDRGDGVIVQPPVFFDFFDILSENDRRLISNPLILTDGGRYEMDFDGLEKVASDPSAKLLFLCNPHNPIGRVWTRDELRKMGDICLKHNVIVVSDDIHGDIVLKDDVRYTPFASLGPEYAQNSITCISPAKSFNVAACCCSFTVVPNTTKRVAFKAENSRLTVNKNNAFANVAMEAAYKHGGPWLEAVIAYLKLNLDLVRERLKDIRGVELVEPEGTFLLWIDFRGLGMASQDDLTAFLRQKARWAITRGAAFGKEGEGFGRLNIACPRSKLAAALDDLEQAVEARIEA